MSLHWNLAVLILLLTPTSFLHPSSSHLPSLLCAHALPTSPPVTRPRILIINEGPDDDYKDYDDDHSSPPSVPSITKSTFILHQEPPKPCKYNPCMEDQQPCAQLSEQTGCLCPGVSRADQRPHAPLLKGLVPVRGKVEVQWCAPSSVVSKYRVMVEGRAALEFGEALRRGLVESLDIGDNVCVEAVNKAGHSVPSETSCMQYEPAESSSHGVMAWVIGGGVAFIILLSLAAVILVCLEASSAWTVSLSVSVSLSPLCLTSWTRSDLKALLNKSQSLLLVDVRSKEEVDKGCIPGSIHIPVDTVESALALDPAEFKTKYGVTKPQLDAPELIFHCQMGKRGGMATDKAHAKGFENARNYAGGYKEWSEKEDK